MENDNATELARLEVEKLKLQNEARKLANKKNENEYGYTVLIILIIAIAAYFFYREHNDREIKDQNPFHKMRN